MKILTRKTTSTEMLRHARRKSTAFIATKLSAILLVLLCKLCQAAPCPKETRLMGSAILDGSADEYETYFVVDDDNLTKIVGMEWCV